MRVSKALLSLLLSMWLTSSCSLPTGQGMTGVAVFKIVELRGDVKIRPGSNLNWQAVTSSRDVYEHDRVFVGESSLAVLKCMVRENTFVRLGSRTFYDVESYGLLSSRLSMGRDWMSEERDFLKARLVRKNTGFYGFFLAESKTENEATMRTQQVGSAGPVGVSVDLQVDEVGTRRPLLSHVLTSDSFPTQLPVSLAGPLGPLQGYLWKIDDAGTRTVVWEGHPRDAEFILSLPEPGKYVFQARSFDGHFKTRAVLITARSQNVKSDARVLSDAILPGDVFWFF